MAYLTGGRGHCVPSKLNTSSGVVCRCKPSVNVKSSNEEHDMTNTKYQIISNSYFADYAVNLDLSNSTKKLSSPIISSSMPVFDFKSYWRS